MRGWKFRSSNKEREES